MATLSDQQINNLRDQLLDAHQQGMKIVITLGPAKTGKSTLINRMIGHEMVAERRNSNGERTTKIGTVGVYHDENVHQDLTSLEVKGRVSTETPVPAIIKHDNICYLDLPEICLPNKYPRVTQVVDPVRTLARLANACNSELPVHALFLVFTEVYFSDSIMIELDKIAKQLSVLFENRRELQNIHLVINDKQVVRTVYKKHGLDNFKANLLSAISDQYIEVLSDSIEKAQDKFHEDIVKLQRNRHGWHPLLNGLVKLTQPQKRENDAKLKSKMLATQFLSRLTHTVQLSFYSTDDVEFINDLLSQRGCLSPLQQRLEPLLIRDLTNKKWLLRAFDGSNRSYDETTIAQPFKDCLNTFGFEKEISAADELRLLRELMFVLYEELPNCKMILFNPLDNGESRQALLDAVNDGQSFDLRELNVTFPPLQVTEETQTEVKDVQPTAAATKQPAKKPDQAETLYPEPASSQTDGTASQTTATQDTNTISPTPQDTTASADTQPTDEIKTFPPKSLNKPVKTKTSEEEKVTPVATRTPEEVKSAQKNMSSPQPSNTATKHQLNRFQQTTRWLKQHTALTTLALLLTVGLLVTGAVALFTPLAPLWLTTLAATQPAVFYPLLISTSLLLTGLATLFTFSLVHKPIETTETQHRSALCDLSTLDTQQASALTYNSAFNTNSEYNNLIHNTKEADPLQHSEIKDSFVDSADTLLEQPSSSQLSL